MANRFNGGRTISIIAFTDGLNHISSKVSSGVVTGLNTAVNIDRRRTGWLRLEQESTIQRSGSFYKMDQQAI